MAKVVIQYDAVRFLCAKAKYGEDKKALRLLQVGSGKGKGKGYDTIFNTPYSKIADTPRVLRAISKFLERQTGLKWYTLLALPDGIDLLYSCVFEGKNYGVIIPKVPRKVTDDLLYDQFRAYEVLVTSEDE